MTIERIIYFEGKVANFILKEIVKGNIIKGIPTKIALNMLCIQECSYNCLKLLFYCFLFSQAVRTIKMMIQIGTVRIIV